MQNGRSAGRRLAGLGRVSRGDAIVGSEAKALPSSVSLSGPADGAAAAVRAGSGSSANSNGRISSPARRRDATEGRCHAMSIMRSLIAAYGRGGVIREIAEVPRAIDGPHVFCANAGGCRPASDVSPDSITGRFRRNRRHCRGHFIVYRGSPIISGLGSAVLFILPRRSCLLLATVFSLLARHLAVLSGRGNFMSCRPFKVTCGRNLGRYLVGA